MSAIPNTSVNQPKSTEKVANAAPTASKCSLAGCNKITETFLRCGGCRTVYYCGKDCQKKDWSRHKVKECPEMRAKYVEITGEKIELKKKKIDDKTDEFIKRKAEVERCGKEFLLESMAALLAKGHSSAEVEAIINAQAKKSHRPPEFEKRFKDSHGGVSIDDYLKKKERLVVERIPQAYGNLRNLQEKKAALTDKRI